MLLLIHVLGNDIVWSFLSLNKFNKSFFYQYVVFFNVKPEPTKPLNSCLICFVSSHLHLPNVIYYLIKLLNYGSEKNFKEEQMSEHD